MDKKTEVRYYFRPVEIEIGASSNGNVALKTINFELDSKPILVKGGFSVIADWWVSAGVFILWLMSKNGLVADILGATIFFGVRDPRRFSNPTRSLYFTNIVSFLQTCS